MLTLNSIHLALVQALHDRIFIEGLEGEQLHIEINTLENMGINVDQCFLALFLPEQPEDDPEDPQEV